MKKYRIIIIVLSVLLALETIILLNFLAVKPKKKIIKPKPAAAVFKGKIAIVLDDWGYNLNNLPVLKQIKYPLTLSILPNLAFSKTVSQEGHELGFEIILHLPMEPHEKIRLEQNTIMNSMSEKQIKNIISQDLESIVYAKGVSNHMGSSLTENPKTMAVIFSQLQERKLYFLDSLSSADSVASDLAKKMYIDFAKRDIFLDNQEDPEYIRGQINKLKFKARANGHAIGIGHDRKITLQVLKEIMPELEKEGYRLVYLSELIK